MGEYYERHDPPFFLNLEPHFKALKINKSAYERPDQEILADVLDRFAGLYGLDTTKVDVRVEGGVVALSGAVDSQRLRDYLGSVAANVLGVRAVESELAVSRAGATGRSEA